MATADDTTALCVRRETFRLIVDVLRLVYRDSPLTADDRAAIVAALDVFQSLLARVK